MTEAERQILPRMTAIELRMYARKGGHVPIWLNPKVGEWYQPDRQREIEAMEAKARSIYETKRKALRAKARERERAKAKAKRLQRKAA